MKDLFRKAGHVVRADVALGHDNRSRGFGTVVFSNEEEAKQAISESSFIHLMLLLLCLLHWYTVEN